VSTKSAMRELRDELTRALEVAEPANPDEVFKALCVHLSNRRGRPVVYYPAGFPPGTASGLYLDMTDRDIICVQANTSPWPQLVIFGHEVWHMIAGHCGDHEKGSAIAARLLADDADLNLALQSVSARTDFHQAEEKAAETFGLELGAHLRGWVEGAASPVPLSELGRRIQASLGHRQG